jgi:hypothetical protein
MLYLPDLHNNTTLAPPLPLSFQLTGYGREHMRVRACRLTRHPRALVLSFQRGSAVGSVLINMRRAELVAAAAVGHLLIHAAWMGKQA